MEKTGKKIFDRLRNIPTLGGEKKSEFEFKETLTPENFVLAEIVRHGFPFQPTCLAFDPVQKLLAIGTQSGTIRILGRPGVDFYLKHESRASLIKLQFLINEGAFISLCSDDCIHLWNFRQKRPDIVHSLKFQKEKLTTMHLPFQSKWLYLGTDRGNVHIVGVETFSLSGYIINWNKAIDLSQKSHPGHIVQLSDCPTDESKLLIGYERGTVVLWDLKLRQAEGRFQCDYALRSFSWHFEGKQFICSHANGCLTTWSVKKCQEPLQMVFPHARGHPSKGQSSQTQTPDSGIASTAVSQKEKFRPISTVDWKHQKGGDDFVIFAGGMPNEEREVNQPCVTVLRGKSVAVLEMQHPIVTFLTLCESPFSYDAQDPYAIVVLLQNDLVVVDLTTSGYPCFENPNPMDIHESPVTSCTYLADCPADLIPAYYSVGSKQKRQGYTDKTWPIKGGECGTCPFSYPEVVITGHVDGSLKFWDASSVNLQVLYKLKTFKLFDKPDANAPADLDLFAIEHIALCPDSRILAVAGEAGHVLLFKFCRSETSTEIPVLEISMTYLSTEESELQESAAITLSKVCSPQKRPELKSQHSVTSLGSNCSLNSDADGAKYLPVKLKGGPQKRQAGYQPELACLTVWQSGHNPECVTSLALNSAYGLLAFGTEKGLCIVDFLQQVCVLTMATPDLYGGSDPYSRSPRPNSLLEKLPSSSDPECFASPNEKSENASVSANSSLDVPAAQSPTNRSPSAGQRASLASTASTSGGSFGGAGGGQQTQTLQQQKLRNPDRSKSQDKEVFDRSRSSSSSSQENLVAIETIRCLNFTDSYFKKNVIPNRKACPVSPTNNGPSSVDLPSSGTPALGSIDQSIHQFVAMCTEKELKLYSLNSMQKCYCVTVDQPLIRSDVIIVEGSPILAGFTKTGRIVAYSLPTLKLLMDVFYLPTSDLRACRTLQFSHRGHGLYMCSPSEIQKFTISNEIAIQLRDVVGDLFQACNMPEPPKQNILKGFFGVSANKSLDREELFGESSGKTSKSVARHIPGAGNLDAVRGQSGGAMNEVMRARLMLNERGDKLSEVEDATVKLMDNSKTYADQASELLKKYKDKKWYKF